MVDDIPVNDLPDEMQKYVTTYTYIDATKLNNEKDLELFRKKLLYVMPKKPIREFNIDRTDHYNYNVPSLFNRMFAYRDHMTKFDRPWQSFQQRTRFWLERHYLSFSVITT